MYYVPQQSIPVPQFAPQGWFGDMVSRQAPLIGGAVGGLTTELSGHASLGGLVGGATTMVARDYGHLIPFTADPMQAAQMQAAQQQQMAYAPQGFWGNMISGVGGAVGNVVGGRTGNIIRDASGLARYLPFEAGPMMASQPAMQQPAYDPQGIFGRIGGGIVGGMVGNHFGNRALGSTIGGALGNFLPFEAGPAQMAQPVGYAPQGFWGNMISGVGGAVGNVVGGRTGNIIRDASGLARYLPFEAGPASYAQPAGYAPQGFWGDMISNVGGAVGDVVGGNTGNIIRDASALGQYLPFSVGPVTAPQVAYEPQGFFGRLGGGLVGGAIGNHFGNRALGSTIGGALGNFLPFEAGPAQMAQPVGYAPQGFWGNMISGVGGAVGNVVGGRTGNIIRDASGLARYLPFEAGPASYAQPAAYDPQGIFGSIGGGLLGGAIGNAFGNRRLGSAIGGAVGAFLPFQAGPGQPIQYIAVEELQAMQNAQAAAANAQAQAQAGQVVYH